MCLNRNRQGHTCLPGMDQLMQEARGRCVEIDSMNDRIMDLIMDKKKLS